MANLMRAEIWSDIEAASGRGGALHIIPDLAELTEEAATTGESTFTAVMPVSSPAAQYVKEGRVLRIILTDESVEERRIVGTERAGGVGQPPRLTVVARSPLHDLGQRALLRTTDAAGRVSYQYDRAGMTQREHIQSEVLPALAAAGLGYWGIGQVDNVRRFDVRYDEDSALSALRKIAGQAEIRARRVGAFQWLIDIIDQVGIDTPLTYAMAGRNLQRLGVKRDIEGQANRVIALGADTDGVRATLSNARWTVTEIRPAVPAFGLQQVVRIADPQGGRPPMSTSADLVGLYVFARPKEIGRRVNATFPDTSSIRIDHANGLTVGQFVWFAANATGQGLTYLDDPVSIAEWGIAVAFVKNGDASDTVNLIPNPLMRDWTGPGSVPPRGWLAMGTPTVARIETAGLWQSALRSAQVTTLTDGQGLASPWAPLDELSTENPTVSGFISYMVTVGRYRTEIDLRGATGRVVTYPEEGQLRRELSSNLLTWEKKGLGNLDVLRLGATSARMRLVQDGATPSQVYVDGASIKTGQPVDVLVEGSAANALWHAAREKRDSYSEPAEAIDAAFVDLSALDGAAFPHDALTVGGPILVRYPALGFVADPYQVTTRIMSVRRDHKGQTITAVTLANRPPALTQTLAQSSQPSRSPLRAPVVPVPAPLVKSLPYILLTVGSVYDGYNNVTDPTRHVVHLQAAPSPTVSRWIVYYRSNAWPTVDGTRDGLLSADYLVFNRSVFAGFDGEVSAGRLYSVARLHAVVGLISTTTPPFGRLNSMQSYVIVVPIDDEGRPAEPVGFAPVVRPGYLDVFPGGILDVSARLVVGTPNVAVVTLDFLESVTPGYKIVLFESRDRAPWRQVAVLPDARTASPEQRFTLTGFTHSTYAYDSVVEWRYQARLVSASGVLSHAVTAEQVLTDRVSLGNPEPL